MSVQTFISLFFRFKGVMGWINEDEFNFWVPAQTLVVKGGKEGSDKSGKRWIQGIASTDARDLQGEIVDQHGIDFSYFLKHGYFNDDHLPGSENKVGEPTECRVTKNGLWVKGFIYTNKKKADAIWEHMNSLASSGAKRQMGFSIQGKVKRREGNIIKECWIQDIAITPAPVNSTTWAEIAKSLSSQKWDLNKTAEDTENKSMAAQNNPMSVESLDSKEKDEKEVSKNLSFDEAVDYIKKSMGMTQEGAEATARVIFSLIEE